MLDFEAISAIAKEYQILFVVDNTTPTPYLFKPIEYGADLVVYSTTKYLAGHGNVMGGVIVDSGNLNGKIILAIHYLTCLTKLIMI